MGRSWKGGERGEVERGEGEARGGGEAERGEGKGREGKGGKRERERERGEEYLKLSTPTVCVEHPNNI